MDEDGYPDGRTPAVHGSDDDAADQGERQPGIREGDDDSDLTVPSGAAWAQLWSYAVLLEVLRNILMVRILSNSQIFAIDIYFLKMYSMFQHTYFSVTIPYAGNA